MKKGNFKKKTKIFVGYGKGRAIAEALNCSEVYVSMVFNGKAPDTSLARKIRHVALKEYNGVEIKI